MENIMENKTREKNMTEKPRYDVLLAQLEYLKANIPGRLSLAAGNKDDVIFVTATSDLAEVCMNLAYDNNEKCNPPCRIEDGMCICA